MALYVIVTTALAVLAFGAVGLAVVFGGALLGSGGRAFVRRTFAGRLMHPVGWAWVAAFLAMSGSLYLSEIVHFVPCSLCWYQRIAMYPLVIVLGVGLLRSEPGVWRYGLPLALIGLAIAVYHVAIQWQPTLDAGVCSSGVPCTARYVAVFGFVSIPTMAGAAFMLIAVMMLVVRMLDAEGAE